MEGGSVFAFEQHIDGFFDQDEQYQANIAKFASKENEIKTKIFEKGLQEITSVLYLQLHEKVAEIEQKILNIKIDQQELLQTLTKNLDPPLSEDPEFLKVARTMSKLPAYLDKLRLVRLKGKEINIQIFKLKQSMARIARDFPGTEPYREVGEFWYQVIYRGGVAVRQGPALQAPTNGQVLAHRQVVLVTERRRFPGDETVYLRLSDNAGWAFESKRGLDAMKRVSARAQHSSETQNQSRSAVEIGSLAREERSASNSSTDSDELVIEV